MDDGRSLGSALQPLKPISTHGVMLPRLSFLGNPSLQFLYKRIAYVARHGHGLKVKDMNDQTNYFSLGTQGDQLSSWLQHHKQIPHLHSTPRALANPSRLCPGPGVEAASLIYCIPLLAPSNGMGLYGKGQLQKPPDFTHPLSLAVC